MRTPRAVLLLLPAAALALSACTAPPVTINSTRTPTASPITTEQAAPTPEPPAGTSPEEASFNTTELPDSPSYFVPDTSPNELARILVTGEETQNLTAATPPVEVPGFKIVGACLPVTDASPATLTITPSDTSGPFTTFTIPCTGTQHIARIGSATPLTPPYALTVQNAESISSGYAQLIEDNADGTR